ncbi:MAG: hypothetical protein GY898_09585 [Proteobacteria bacterium]|nr:hypothetical protein [Pseudomonadota bacterium]
MRIAAAAVAATVLIAVPSLADAPKVNVEVSRQLYEPGDTVEIAVTNEAAGAVFLQGCASFQLEVFENESYRPVELEKCASEGEALEVPNGQFDLSFVSTNSLSGKILRISVPYGWGCESARPLSQARCTEFATAHSSNFRVGKKDKQ